jgi:hypothetical protein
MIALHPIHDDNVVKNELQVAAMPSLQTPFRKPRLTSPITPPPISVSTPSSPTTRNLDLPEHENEFFQASHPRRSSMHEVIGSEGLRRRIRSHSGDRQPQRSKRLFYKRKNTFVAERITKGDYFLRGYENIDVLVDTIGKQLIITVDKQQIHEEYNEEQDYSTSDSEDSETEVINERGGNRIVIKWSDISGLDFQYSPLGPAIVVIELSNVPTEAPKRFSSNFYFIYCTKEDCERYLDNQMLKSDTRLLKLAIQSLPNWAVIVNRYSIPIYYSFKFRTIITTLVNIYIVISLIWGFYDLYKNLPIVGGALRRIIGPIVAAMEPLLHNRVVLLIPLLLSRLYAIYNNLIAPIIENLFYPIIQFGTKLVLPLVRSIGYVIGRFYSLIYPLVDIILTIFTLIGRLFSSIYWLLWTLLKAPVEFAFMLKSLLFGQMQFVISFFGTIFEFVGTFVRFIILPFQKLKSLFVIQKPVVDAVQATAHTAAQMRDIKGYYDQVKDNYVMPVSSLWAGLRRIIDSIIHTYHTKIKHHDVLIRRLMISFLCLSILIALIVVIVLIL